MPLKIRKAQALAIGAAIVINLAVGVAAVSVYVYPASDAPSSTDAVFVIGPPTATRIAIAERMVDEGLTSTVVVSVPATGTFQAANLPICTDKQTFTVYCLTPDPFTTQGEARLLRDLAREHSWTDATVITFTPHVTRTRVLMDRCFTGDLKIVADTVPLAPSRWFHEFVYQTGAFAKVFWEQDC